MERSTTTQTEARRDAIKSFMIENPNKWFSTTDFAYEYGVSRVAIQKDIHKIQETLGGRIESSKRGYMFVPEDRTDEPAIEEPADKFVSPWVNHEGYSDPTAKSALDTTSKFKEGEVWEVQTHTGNTELVLILKAYESKIVVVPIYEPKKYNITDENRAYTRYIKYDDKYGYYFDIRCIRPKPAKYFVEMQFPLLASEYTKIIADTARLFYDEDVTRRIDILETQANKYRSMISDLKAEKENAERAVDVKEKLIRELQISLKNLSDENESLKSRIVEAEPEPVNNVQMLLMAQKIDIYEKILGITWED